MSVLIYIIEVSISLMLFYLLYILVFRRYTFFVFNRIYILLTSVGSFLIPFIKFPLDVIETNISNYSLGIDWENIMQSSQLIEVPIAAQSNFQLISFLLLIYGIISAFRIFRGIRQYIRIRTLYSSGTIAYSGGIRLNIHPEISSPFTMFRTVYLDRYTFKQVNSPVIRHEMVHARQLHSIDLLISEIICAFLWFNPFVFLFKKQMRDNHEFLADNEASADQQCLITYMQALSSELSRKYDPVFASYFQSSTIKKRIIMLTNNKSKSRNKWLYLLIIPIIGISAIAFQKPVDQAFNESSLLSISKISSSIGQEKSGSDIPSRFPLEEKYKDAVTFSYNKEANNPITGKHMTHKGIDFRAPKRTPVFASGNGIIVKSTEDEAYGKIIIIQHADTYTSLYAHLNDLLVNEGDAVKIGDKIGTVGTSGRSTGDHLHYEVRKDGENVNPADYY